MKFLNNELSNIDIIDIIKSYRINNFNGVFMCDLLPAILETGFYVVNIQNSKDGNGTHWCAIYKSSDGENIYFDPFGFIANEETEKRIIPYAWSPKTLQNIDSSSCGYYCISFIKFLDNKTHKLKAFKVFLKLFSNDTEQNEIILHDILN